MATVLLLRHGRTTSNASGTLAGRSPVSLDDTGVAQAVDVGRRLAGLPLAAVVSSPLPRCLQTLEHALPSATPAIDAGLIECGYGDWEGQALKQLAKDPLWRVVQQHPSAVRFPGAEGEAMSAMSARAVATIRAWDERISSEHGPDALWLACSHGDLIKSIVADALGMHLDLFQRVVVDPASVTVIRYTSGRPFLAKLNDTGGGLGGLVVAKKSKRRRAAATDSDATVGGGAGTALTGTARTGPGSGSAPSHAAG